jgi:hypothetical protein
VGEIGEGQALSRTLAEHVRERAALLQDDAIEVRNEEQRRTGFKEPLQSTGR